MTHRNRQLVRCLRLMALLRSGRWTLASLAQTLQVSTRTIRRDLVAIGEAHLPISYTGQGRERVWWLRDPGQWNAA